MATQRWVRWTWNKRFHKKLSYIAVSFVTGQTEVVAVNLEQAVPRKGLICAIINVLEIPYKCANIFVANSRHWKEAIRKKWCQCRMYGENCAQRRYKMMQTSLHRRLDRPDKVTKLSTLSADTVKTCGDNETMKRTRLRARLRIMIAERRNLNKGVPLPSMPCKGTDKISVVAIT
ncbi:hypothetical protein BU17DRAFT_62573 [Hysterangium stoloniferum]|nr:hypothetical protein BU17DRAFT_62573 [Hysterangium stoloniferum]